MHDCIFCKIASKEIPSAIIYEDDHFIAFLDINPRSIGHALLIPKDHIERYDESPENITENIGKVLYHVSKEITNKLNATGFNILSNNGEAAGQVVKHLHFHIIPRYGDKGHSLEAAFPVDENAKKEIENTYRTIGIIPPLSYSRNIGIPDTIENKDEKIERDNQSDDEEDDEYILDQRDVLPDS